MSEILSINTTSTPLLTLMHPTCGTTLTDQPLCQYCASPFKDVLLHKDKYLSVCNHAYCLSCFDYLLHNEKKCTICETVMKHKFRPSQHNHNRFHTKSRARSSYSLHFESSQGKLKMVKVNTVSPFPFIESAQATLPIKSIESISLKKNKGCNQKNILVQNNYHGLVDCYVDYSFLHNNLQHTCSIVES